MSRLLLTTFVANLAAMILLPAAPCHAQFLDEFNGSALAPHWTIGPFPAALQHHVSDGILHVTGLPWPSNPKSPSNRAFLSTTFNPVAGEVLARATVGWDPGQDRLLEFNVSSGPSLLAAIWLGEQAPTGPVIRFQVSGSPGVDDFPAPSSGMHEFAMLRHQTPQGMMVSAYLDGELLVTRLTSVLGPVSAASLTFLVGFPNTGMQPMYVDRVQVVPAPPAVSVLLCTTLNIVFRWRRRQ